MHCDLGGFRQIRIEPHGDPMRGSFRARPFQMHVLVQDELKHAGERSLHSGDVHLSVAHAGVAVADLEQRAARVYWNEESGTGHQLLVVQVAGVNARRSAVYFTGAFGRSDAHAAEKRLERNLDAGSEGSDVAHAIQWNDLGPGAFELI